MKKIKLITLLLLSYASQAQEQPIVVNAQNKTLEINYLKEGRKDYLVYFTDGTKTNRTSGDLWRRSTTKGKLNDQEVYIFKWVAFANGKLFRETTNICEANTLSPLFHKTIIHKIGDENFDTRAGVYAYNYHSNQQIPTDSIPNNRAIEFGVKPITIHIVS